MAASKQPYVAGHTSHTGETPVRIWIADNFADLPVVGSNVQEGDLGLCRNGFIYNFDINTSGWTLKFDPADTIAEIAGLTVQLAFAREKSFTLESPVVNDLFHIFTTQQALTLTRMDVFLRGSSSPSVTWKVHYGPDPSAAGTLVVTAGTTTTTTSTIQTITTFDNRTPQTGDTVWLEITAQSGVVTELHLTLFF